METLIKLHESCLGLKAELRGFDMFAEVAALPSFASEPDREVDESRLQMALENQQRQYDRLQNMLKWARIDLQDQEQYRKELQDDAVTDFMFLRSQWASFRTAKPAEDLEDRIDRLNKVVAVLRGKITRRVQKERQASPTLCSSIEDEEEYQSQASLLLNDRLVQKQQIQLESALMRSEEYYTKLQALDSKYKQVLADNELKTAELVRVKEKLRTTENSLLQTSKREHEAVSKFTRVREELQKFKKRQQEGKVLCKGPDYQLEILKQGLVLPGQNMQTTKKLDQLLDFLSGVSFSEDSSGFSQINDSSSVLDCSTMSVLETLNRVCSTRETSAHHYYGSPDTCPQKTLLTSRSRKALNNCREEVTQVKFKRTALKQNCSTGALLKKPIEHATLQRGFYTKFNKIDEGPALKLKITNN